MPLSRKRLGSLAVHVHTRPYAAMRHVHPLFGNYLCIVSGLAHPCSSLLLVLGHNLGPGNITAFCYEARPRLAPIPKLLYCQVSR
jgi:hypothetical protein